MTTTELWWLIFMIFSDLHYFSIHSFGLTPVAFLKARLKVALLLKPQS